MTLVFIVSIIVILFDQITKWFIQSNASFHNLECISGFFSITYAENTGMAWSLLSGQQAFLSVVAAIAIGGMLYYLIKEKPDCLTSISLSLMIGGAAGNLIDRLFLGYVRDFLDFIIFGYDFPIFNIADCALTIGVVMLIIASFMEEKNK